MKVKSKLMLCAMALVSSQSLFAHTTFQTPVITEGGSGYDSFYNNLVIGHGCKNGVPGTPNSPVIANTYIWPEFASADVYTSAGIVPNLDPISIINQPKISTMPGTNIFAKGGINWGSDATFTTPVGAYAWNGNLPGSGAKGLVPMAIGYTKIVTTSCAKSVTFEVDVLDVCKITTFAGAKEKFVDVWASKVGSKWESVTATKDLDAAAKYTVTRSKSNKLPANCKPAIGIDYFIKASPEQINNQLKIPDIYPAK